MPSLKAFPKEIPNYTGPEGGMTLYCKAAADGISIGDCPFCHAICMVLEEKKLPYELQPATAKTKPSWLAEHYDGKMPALRHKKEAYVESDVILAYLQFFFPTDLIDAEGVAEDAAAALFPAVAQYIKHTPDGDEVDQEKRENLKNVLSTMQQHLEATNGDYWAGDVFSVQDCRLAPKLYHMVTCLKAFKGSPQGMDLPSEFPAVYSYIQALFARPSFQATVYPESVVEWGWGNARKATTANN